MYAVITADVVHSRQWNQFPALRNRRLKKASAAHRAAGWVLDRYTVTTWDEFQNVAAEVRYVPRLIFDLQRLFYPLRLRIGVGIGKLDRPLRGPLNLAGGEAFVLAREAVEQLESGKGGKFERTTYVRCGLALLQDLANLFFGLEDSLVGSISEKQWATINAQIASPNQDVAARKLHIASSTVSRNLRRAHYWQIQNSIQTMEGVLGTLLHENVQFGRK